MRDTSTSRGPAERGDASAEVSGDSADVLAAQFDLAGVQPSSNLKSELGCGVRNREAARHGSGRAIETREDAVTGELHQDAPMALDPAFDESIVAIEEPLPRASPSAVARAVEPTMSVYSTVASTRSAKPIGRTPVTNSSKVVHPIDDRARGLKNGEVGVELDREEPRARNVLRQVFAARKRDRVVIHRVHYKRGHRDGRQDRTHIDEPVHLH